MPNTFWTRPLSNWNLQEWWSKTLQMPPSRTNVTDSHCSGTSSATTQSTPQANKNMRRSRMYHPINQGCHT
jgi:hypothetical protein